MNRSSFKRAGLFRKIRHFFGFKRLAKKRICLVVNPSAGQQTPDLKIINKVFRQGGYDWNIEITNRFGDGRRMAREAAASGVACVAVYGGDGTVMDVAAGLAGSSIPLAILPGGTGNALSMELGIPRDLELACSLLLEGKSKHRRIDVGLVNGHLFALRAGVGLEALIARQADRSSKDQFGVLAYAIATLQVLNTSGISKYILQLDGQKIEMEGLTCMIANAGTTGIPGLALSPRVQIDDGLLDVFVIRKSDLATIYSMVASMIGSTESLPDFPHWQARKVILTADPPQAFQGDGDVLGQTPVTAEVMAGALTILAPV